MKKIILAILLFPILLFSEKYQLSICAIFQNEAEYLNEWILYHYKKGVDHFYLYNNNSTDKWREEILPWIEEGIVEVREWPHKPEENDWKNFSFTIQTGAYNHCLKKCRGQTKWLAIIDTDEFIVPVNDTNIIKILEKQFPQCSGVAINWQCYGTSHVKKANILHKELVYKMEWDDPWNKNSKCIVQPLHVDTCTNPHFCIYKYNHWCVDTNGNRLESTCTSVQIDKLRINHYWARDEWFFWNVKIPRYQKWGSDIESLCKHAENMNAVYDPL